MSEQSNSIDPLLLDGGIEVASPAELAQFNFIVRVNNEASTHGIVIEVTAMDRIMPVE